MEIKKTDRQSTRQVFTTGAEPKSEKTVLAAGSAAGFSELLSEQHTRNWKEAMDALLDEIEAQAEKLAGSRRQADLARYKELVKAFMQEAVRRAYGVQEARSIDSKGRTRILSLVQKVDKEVEELAQIVLENQADQMEILAKISGIKGMLVDMYR